MKVLKILKKFKWVEQIVIMLMVNIFIYVQSCSLITDLIVDCIDDDRPEFKTDTIPEATLNSFYHTTINAHVKNEPDDDFIFDFSFRGSLPDSMYYHLDEKNRQVIVWGKPKRTGTFTFTLILEVEYIYDTENTSIGEDEPYDDGDPLCSNYTEEDFYLVVN